MKKILATFLVVTLSVTAFGAQLMSKNLINGAGVMVTNNTTWYWYSTNVPYATEMLAGALAVNPFTVPNGTNAPTSSLLTGMPTPARDVAYSRTTLYKSWTNNATAGNWNTTGTNLTANADWWRAAVLEGGAPNANGWTPTTFTFGLAGSALTASNVITIVLTKAGVGTNYCLLPADYISIAVTNGQQATGIPVATTPTYWSFGLSSNFVSGTRSVRIHSVAASDLGAANQVQLFDAFINQWVP